ncbi:type 1 glutamine amidotransferase domain-containing protein [Balneolaceae bacterium ANBcel3]|nr:type 1 glutamine amidotransferase domain-containing protein [Balneolaceae bacterium ANBcel3]
MHILHKIAPLALLFILLSMTACEDHAEVHVTEPADPAPLYGKEVAFLIAEGFHDGETLYPMAHLINYGARVTVIGIETGEHTAYNSDITARVQRTIDEVSPQDFDALVIPGGHSPSNLRENEAVLDFVRAFSQTGNPLAAICHGPQVLVSADIVSGRTLTGFQAIEDEILEAGATFEDSELIVDGNIITSRIPDDLPAFSRQIVDALK